MTDWTGFFNAFRRQFGSTTDPSEQKTEQAEQEQETIIPQAVVEAKYEAYTDKHIIEKPQEVVIAEDGLIAAQITDDEFHEVLGKLPDGEPSVRPENDAEYTPIERRRAGRPKGAKNKPKTGKKKKPAKKPAKTKKA